MNNLSIRKMNELSKKKKKGFTLVELIIVIAIIAVLAAIAIPKFGQITKKSNITADIATAKNLSGIAAQAVADDQTLLGGTTDNIKTALLKKVDGGVMPKSKVNSQEFVVTIDSNGDIKVKANSVDVYPNQGDSFKVS